MIQNPKVRAFVEVYSNKPMPKMTVKDFIKSHNHEILRKCPNCKEEQDVRKSFYCNKCGSQIAINLNDV